jgi:hypothetical protein
MRRCANLAIGLGLVLGMHGAWGGLNKCTDANGRVTYSDTACASGPAPAAAAKPNQPPPNKVAGAKLTEAAVDKVLRHAADLAIRSDYQRQCALAAADLKFTITDHSTAPAKILTGGRREICAAQLESARVIEANRLVPSIRLGKISISVDAGGGKATARYDSVTTLTQQGQAVLVLQCAREEVLGLYGDQILYSQVTATCKPAG